MMSHDISKGWLACVVPSGACGWGGYAVDTDHIRYPCSDLLLISLPVETLFCLLSCHKDSKPNRDRNPNVIMQLSEDVFCMLLGKTVCASSSVVVVPWNVWHKTRRKVFYNPHARQAGMFSPAAIPWWWVPVLHLVLVLRTYLHFLLHCAVHFQDCCHYTSSGFNLLGGGSFSPKHSSSPPPQKFSQLQFKIMA